MRIFEVESSRAGVEVIDVEGDAGRPPFIEAIARLVRRLAVFEERDVDDVRAEVLELLPPAFDRLDFAAARFAPRGEDLYDRHFAGQRYGAQCGAIRRGKVDWGDSLVRGQRSLASREDQRERGCCRAAVAAVGTVAWLGHVVRGCVPLGLVPVTAEGWEVGAHGLWRVSRCL
jgi:hypothetical protein